jgi:hypothetical protein
LWFEGFSEQKLCALAPMAAMSAGVVTLLRAFVLGTFSTLAFRVKTLDHLGLDDGGA